MGVEKEWFSAFHQTLKIPLRSSVSVNSSSLRALKQQIAQVSICLHTHKHQPSHRNSSFEYLHLSPSKVLLHAILSEIWLSQQMNITSHLQSREITLKEINFFHSSTHKQADKHLLASGETMVPSSGSSVYHRGTQETLCHHASKTMDALSNTDRSFLSVHPCAASKR